jgi:hypothetical protein
MISKAQQNLIKAIYDLIRKDTLREWASYGGGLRHAIRTAKKPVYISVCADESGIKHVNYKSVFALERKGLITVEVEHSQRTVIKNYPFKRTWGTKVIYETEYAVKLTKKGKALAEELAGKANLGE